MPAIHIRSSLPVMRILGGISRDSGSQAMFRLNLEVETLQHENETLQTRSVDMEQERQQALQNAEVVALLLILLLLIWCCATGIEGSVARPEGAC